MKRTVSMLTAALLAGAIALPAFAQAPAERPRRLRRPRPAARGRRWNDDTRLRSIISKHHHAKKKAAAEMASPAAESSMAAPAASPAQ